MLKFGSLTITLSLFVQNCTVKVGCTVYICMSVCRMLWETHTKKTYAKMRGKNYVIQTRACSKSVWEFETKCCLEYLILLSSWRLKLTCDTCTIHFYYKRLWHGRKKTTRHLEMRKVPV